MASEAPITPATLNRIRELAPNTPAFRIAVELGWSLVKLHRIARERLGRIDLVEVVKLEQPRKPRRQVHSPDDEQVRENSHGDWTKITAAYSLDEVILNLPMRQAQIVHALKPTLGGDALMPIIELADRINLTVSASAITQSIKRANRHLEWSRFLIETRCGRRGGARLVERWP